MVSYCTYYLLIKYDSRKQASSQCLILPIFMKFTWQCQNNWEIVSKKCCLNILLHVIPCVVFYLLTGYNEWHSLNFKSLEIQMLAGNTAMPCCPTPFSKSVSHFFKKAFLNQKKKVKTMSLSFSLFKKGYLTF